MTFKIKSKAHLASFLIIASTLSVWSSASWAVFSRTRAYRDVVHTRGPLPAGPSPVEDAADYESDSSTEEDDTQDDLVHVRAEGSSHLFAPLITSDNWDGPVTPMTPTDVLEDSEETRRRWPLAFPAHSAEQAASSTSVSQNDISSSSQETPDADLAADEVQELPEAKLRALNPRPYQVNLPVASSAAASSVVGEHELTSEASAAPVRQRKPAYSLLTRCLIAGAAVAGGAIALDYATAPQPQAAILPSPAPANMTALQQHLYYFKVDRSNRDPQSFLKDPASFQEMTQRIRELGLPLAQAAAIALFSDLTIGTMTRGCPFTGIGIDKIHQGMHAPVHSGVFDAAGRFDESALKALFKKYAGGRKFITRSELQKMTDDRYAETGLSKPWQLAYWRNKLARFGSNGEWDALLRAHPYRVGDEPAIRYKNLRSFFVDAGLFYQMRKAQAEAR